MTNCKRNSAVVAENATDFPKDTVHSLDLDLKKNGMLRLAYKPDGLWDKVAEEMMVLLKRKRASGIQVNEPFHPVDL